MRIFYIRECVKYRRHRTKNRQIVVTKSSSVATLSPVFSLKKRDKTNLKALKARS